MRNGFGGRQKSSGILHTAQCHPVLRRTFPMLYLSAEQNNSHVVALSVLHSVQVARPPRKRLCNARIRCSLTPVIWNGNEPVHQGLSASSVSLLRPSASIDGLVLFQLCQTWPDLKELKVSAASFNSPVRGQWGLRSLQRLHVVFDRLLDEEKSVEQFLQHADKLYLQELTLSYTGPGFARLHASSLARLHVEKLTLEGFDICKSGKLAHNSGCLRDCTLDVSQADLAFLQYLKNSAPALVLERCRLPAQTFPWRKLSFVCAFMSLIVVFYRLCLFFPAPTLVVTGLLLVTLYLFPGVLQRGTH